ncbi:pantoate--beta-alanine ligase [Bacillus alkalisoli]|uniref:pantoate--beta-alanine ligase n=1 Tax=Bacillus alkalisoli TaxID=2011008 RepID=UPI000C2351D4|nr:pantoate--beta-alanine ligase [Bacillus alkalisoli]
MKIINHIKELQEQCQNFKKEGKTIGFVPTMGFLHEGHLQLLQQARKENDIVILSIFVNPLQFGPNEDFDAYPRDMERDENLAKEQHVDYLFYPTKEEMYPKERTTKLLVEKRTDVLCGKYRPGHFDGVVTVVLKLFNIVMADRAYFGMKDAQQVAVIEGLVEDFNVPVEIVRVTTVREEDGLAKSSRNVYLSEKERLEAPIIYKTLQEGKELVLNGNSTQNVKQFIKEKIEKETSGALEYIEVLSYPELQDVNNNSTAIMAIAVKFSNARLIDNIVFST